MNRTLEEKIIRIKQHMFSEKAGFPLTKHELQIKSRLQQIFTIWVDEPWQSEQQIRNYIKSTFGRTDYEAREDIHMVKFILGDVKNADRSFHQHMVNQMILKVWRLAGAKQDLAQMNAAARNYGQYNRLDKDAPEDLPFDQIIPPDWDITNDVRVIGLQPIKDLENFKSKMRKKYLGDDDAEEVQDLTDKQ